MRATKVNADGTPRYSNRLVDATSPYLLQHAHNPVDWYPWGPEAFEKARREDKPLHVSIGYSSCHWCHVLAEESFEDEETARLLNEKFVNIKVDREERPDIDRIYQIAQHLITRRSGGWPLTMFLLPEDQRPFFGGTYFPKEARYGLPAFKDVLARVAEYFASHRAELGQQSAALMQVFGEIDAATARADVRLDATPIGAARTQLADSFDSKYGGFGGAPKFPHPLTLELLLSIWHASAARPEPDLHALYMATLTLRRMGEGGINDQLAGGFCRYSVDPYWMIPHFEKMLYDNGALLAVYADASLATGDPFYARVTTETAEWTMREMQSPDGGYFSSFDADSEGHEGKYYVWDRAEVERALTSEEYAAFAPRYGLDREANFEGRWHLHTCASLEELAGRLGQSRERVESLIESARRKLLAIRSGRVPPARDDKILTSWNALTIRGIARAARALGRTDFAASASRALRFLQDNHWRDGRLLATSRGGRAHLPAYLDDYAYLAGAVLELLTVRFSAADLELARQLVEVILAHFADRESGGLHFTSDEHEALIHRSMSFGDDATPSGNGIAALVLQRMGYLLGEPRYLQAAERILRAAWNGIETHPTSHVSLLLALGEYVHPPEIVILRGDDAEIERWRAELAKVYAPHRLTIAIPAGETDLPPALAEKTAPGRCISAEPAASAQAAASAPLPPRVLAYVCRGSVCSPPIDSLERLAVELRPGTAVADRAAQPGARG